MLSRVKISPVSGHLSSPQERSPETNSPRKVRRRRCSVLLITLWIMYSDARHSRMPTTTQKITDAMHAAAGK